MKPTLVIGASTNPERYSYKAILKLRMFKHDVFAYGLRNGNVADVSINKEWPKNVKVDTVTMYINPSRQEAYYQRIIDLKPSRVIFNPGAENGEFAAKLIENGISYDNACTLVLLSIDSY
ncbi:MAG: putative CoA-binding protein [Flavobacteriales bacterium]|jgi:predicted CoA-binding protein